jgi:hypothetical protein
MRSVAFALARALNAAFFLATSIYCLLAYSPFAYQQFLKPAVIAWLPGFLAIHTALFWLVYLITMLTLLSWLQARSTPKVPPAPEPQLVSGSGRNAARAYAIAGALLGIWLVVRPLMPSIDNNRRSFAVALLALVLPLWLAVVDHIIYPAPRLRPSNERHTLETCGMAAAVIWAAYAIGAPFRLLGTPGVQLSSASLALAAVSSAVAHAFVFMAIFLALAALSGLANIFRHSGAVEYGLLMVGTAVTIASILYGLVFSSFAFAGFDAAIAAIGVGATIVMVWSGIAREGGASIDSADDGVVPTALQLWLAPATANGSRLAAWAIVVTLPAIAYALVNLTGGLDWNFVIQKLGVLVVWLAAVAAAHVLRRQFQSPSAALLSVVPPCLALVLFQAAAPFGARPGLAERYASVDMSFRFIRDLRVARSGETAAFYALLKEHTLVPPLQVTPPDIRLAGERRSASRPPHIFLFLIDSLRRDYVSAYNPAVTFTPAIGQFAADSFVFDRAMTRYAGTALAVPSIWAGSMLIHMLDERPFDSRNALLALLDADGYRRVMSVDHIMRDLLPSGRLGVELDRGVAPMDSDFCHTMRELEARLTESSSDRRPVFSYALPQNVHIAVASKRQVPEGHTYPGFFAPVAESVRQVDECFGEFVAFLKRSKIYDDSIVVLTSDHGDSLGEEGRWGHAYFMVPEVMRIPLIIHVPPDLRAHVRADLHQVSFSTDITPTLYALLDHPSRDLGPLFGAPLLVDWQRQLPSRRRDSFLLASSYGAVYGMLRHNGRLLYASDAIDGRDDEYDLNSLSGERVTATGAMTALNRRQMTEQLRQLAALNQFVPHP